MQEDFNGSLSAEQIESAVSERNAVPAQAEINVSLEAIRTEATSTGAVLDSSKFETLLQDLTTGYTVHQLGRYLDRSIRTQSSSRLRELRASPWQASLSAPTPLTQRLRMDARRRSPSTKLKIAEQILRLAWEITVESEDNQDGELEIELKSWQLSFLFDLRKNGKRYLDEILVPQTLLQSSDIQPYRPDNIVRITARRQIAEEIAQQLQLALFRVYRLGWNTKPLMSNISDLETTSTQLFRDQDISYIAQLTESVVIPEGEGVLAIYSASRDGALNARRLLLALLDQYQASFDDTAHRLVQDPTSDLPVGNPKTGIQRRYLGRGLLRTVVPLVATKSGTHTGMSQAKDRWNKVAMSLAEELNSVEPLRTVQAPTNSNNTYWHDSVSGVSNTWKAKFCTLLRVDGNSKTSVDSLGSPTTPRHVVQHTVPGLETLLSYFKGRGSDCGTGQAARNFGSGPILPFIKAHLQPLSTNLGSGTLLPRLEMYLHSPRSESDSGLRELVLSGLHAVADEQRLSVPLPEYITDLQFVRRSEFSARVDAAKADTNILQFVKQVQKSARKSTGALTAPAELVVKLPSWLIDRNNCGNSVASKDVPVKYIFERFEQIQNMVFFPDRDGRSLQDDACPNMLEDLPEHLYLDYREVEGGAIYGNSTVLSLGLGSGHETGDASIREEQQHEHTSTMPLLGSSLDLAGAALRIAHLWTRANSGGLVHCSK